MPDANKSFPEKADARLLQMLRCSRPMSVKRGTPAKVPKANAKAEKRAL